MKLIKYHLWKIKRAGSPSRQFKDKLWRRLDAAWEADRMPTYRWYQRHLARFGAALASVVLVSGSLTTGAYAYINPEVIEGTALYPVKQIIERVEEKLQLSPEAKARFILKTIHRREAELVLMEVRKLKTEKIKARINEAEDKLERAAAKISTSTPKGIRALKKIQNRLELKKGKFNKKIRAINEKAPGGERGAVEARARFTR